MNKRIFKTVLIGLLGASLIGCGSTNKNSDNATPNQETTQTENSTAAPTAEAEKKVVAWKELGCYDIDENQDRIQMTSEYKYDDQGNVTYHYLSQAKRETLYYKNDYEDGKLMQITASESEGGDSVVYTYKFAYDQAGNILKETRSNSEGEDDLIIENKYDAKGNRIDCKRIISMGDVGLITDTHFGYEYDDNGNCVKEICYKNDTDEIGYYTVNTYDKENNKINEIRYTADEEELFTIASTYDKDKKVWVRNRSQNGKVTSKEEYNLEGDCMASYYTNDGEMVTDKEATCSYDENGHKHVYSKQMETGDVFEIEFEPVYDETKELEVWYE